MLTELDNRLLTEVGAGTPTGSFMREFWIPVLRSPQLEPGAAPRRLTVMGDRLVAFRSPGGDVGVMDEACPHRGASMALAHNEKCGLRCIYHGWKINAAGDLVEAPTHPEGARIDKIHTRSHPVRESQGMIWTWLGRGEAPPFPKLAFTDLPDDHVVTATAILNCGWLQPLETLWDVFHSQILHNQTNRASARAKQYFTEAGRKAGGIEFDYPEMSATRTDYGFKYSNIDGAKITNFEFVLPFLQYHTTSPGPLVDRVLQASVPIDDQHTLLWIIFYNRATPLQPDGLGRAALSELPDQNNFMAGMERRDADNLWGQDREAVARGESFAGIINMGRMTIMAEDVCVVESQGLVDRTRETLTPVDRALVEGRATVLDAIRAHQRGEAPQSLTKDLSNVEALFVPKQAVAS